MSENKILKLHDAIERATKVKRWILHSNMPEESRLQMADEILYLIDDLQELQKEEK